MAEEIRIENVGGENGVASEVTLERLVKAVEHMAKKDGYDPKKVTKKLTELSEAIDDNIDVVTENRDALEDQTAEINKSTQAMSKLSKGMLSLALNAVSSVASSVFNLGSELALGGSKLSDFAQHVPIVGSYLTTFTGHLDSTFEVFRDVSSSGASFNNSMQDMMRAAAGARMDVESFGAMVANNSKELAAIGGTATKGAQMIGKLQQGLGGMRDDLLNMGFTFEEINEGMISFANINRAGSRAQKQDTAQLAQAAGSYMKNLSKLSKLTGKSVDELEKEVAQRNLNAAFQMKLGKMDAEQRSRIQEGLATALATGGDAAGDRFMQMVLGMAPLTQETQMLAATMPGVEKALRGLHDSAMNASSAEDFAQSQTDAMVDMIAGAAESGKKFGTVISAAAAGMDGPGADILNILNGFGKDFSDYTDKQGNLDKEALKADIEAAAAENKKRGNLTKAMAAFDENITNAKRTIQEQFINSGIYETAANMISQFAEILGSPEVINAFEDGLGILKQFLQSFKEDPMAAIGGVFERIADKIGEFLFGKSEEDAQAEKEADMSRVSDSISNLKDELAFLQDAKATGVATEEDNARIEQLTGQLEARQAELAKIQETEVKATSGIVAKGMSSLWENSSLVTKVALGAAGLFAAGAVVSAVSNGVKGLLGGFGLGGDDSTGSNKKSKGDAGKGVGSAIGNIGKGIGKGIGGILQGLATGISAFANPAVILGAASLAGAIVLIGGAIAGATWMVGKSLPTMAEGLESFEELDGAKLIDAGKGMAAVAGGMAAFGVGTAVAGLGNLVGSITNSLAGLFPAGGKSPLEQLKEFSKADIDGAKVKTNAEALVAFSQAMAVQGAGAAASGAGAAVGAIGNAIAGFFGGETGIPYDDITKFQGYTFDKAKIEANAGALAAFNKVISEHLSANAGNVVSSIGSAIAGFFGSETKIPYDEITKFQGYTFDQAKIESNAKALAAFNNAISSQLKAGAGNIISSIGSTIAGFFGSETKIPYDDIKTFEGYSFDSAKIKDNADALIAFNNAITSSAEAQAAANAGSAVASIGSSIAGFFGGETGIPYDSIIKFQGYAFDVAKITANAAALVAFNKALTSSSDAQKTSGVGNAIGAIGNAIASFFGADTPFDQVKEFGEMDINAEGVKINAEAMSSMAKALSSFTGEKINDIEIPSSIVASLKSLNSITGTGISTAASGLQDLANVTGLPGMIASLNSLDATSITSYNSAMEKLVETLEDLNEVLAEDNKGMFGSGTGVAASNVIGNANEASAAAGNDSGLSAEKLDQLNSTMRQVALLLTQVSENTRKTSKGIENIGQVY